MMHSLHSFQNVQSWEASTVAGNDEILTSLNNGGFNPFEKY